jgi:PAS domain S-box-containing protein
MAERKQAEEAQAALAAIVTSSEDAIIGKALDGSFTSWNTGAERIFGFTAEEVLGRPGSILMLPDHLGEEAASLEEILRGRPVEHLETIRVRKDGRRIPVSITLSPIRNLEGSVVGISKIARDITEQKQAAEELFQAKEAAEAGSRAKSEFLATMSHEIRTPMNGIIGVLGLLDDHQLTARQKELADIARSSAHSLLTIINDILDFSKMEAGKLQLETTHFSVRRVIEEAADILASQASQKGVELVVQCDADMPRRVMGDAGRLRQVLVNLAGNAVKFTSQGHVMLSITVESRSERDAVLRFSVEDTGIGIADEKIGRLFEQFTQADASTTRNYGGTGLGLAICKRLVGLMGGEISVTSRSGQGSTFGFTLRLPLSPEQQEGAGSPRGLAHARVLIVDDYELNRRVLTEQMTAWGIRSDAVASGPDALDALRVAERAGDPYHLALLDYRMPGMDGERLGREIKSAPALREITLVMLSSLGQRDEERRLREAGFAVCLSKPVHSSQLMDALATAWAARTGAAPAEPAASDRTVGAAPVGYPWEGARVLVADDNATNQQVAQLMLEHLGCRVDVVADGREAVRMVEALPYDLVLMDCEMPELDGFAATAEIRSREGNGVRLPIIAVTAKALQGDRERCLAAGMDDYLSKPVQVEGLEAALRRWMRGRKPHAAGALPPNGKTTPTVAPEPREETAGGLDPAVMARLRALAEQVDPSMLSQLSRTFQDDATGRVTLLRQAAAAGDTAGMRKTAHALKGACANLGATKMAEISGQIEGLDETPERAGALLDGLETEFERVRRELAQEIPAGV